MSTKNISVKIKRKILSMILNSYKPLFRFYYKLEAIHRKLSIQFGASTTIGERPYEYGFALNNLPFGKEIRVLDIGTGSSAFGALLKNCNYLVDCLENTKYRRGKLPLNSHCNLINGDIVDSNLPNNCYDAVTCISVLEHIKQYDRAVENMVRVLKPGGVLVLTIPYTHERFIENCYAQKESNRYNKPTSYICNVYSGREIENWCALTRLTVEKQIFGCCWTGPFWNSGERLGRYHEVAKDQKHDHSCVVLKKGKVNCK